MNILVLGGNGFIGSHLVDAFKAAGHNVRVLSRSPEKYRSPLPGIDYRLGDFCDPSFLSSALHGQDVVFHCLSSTVPATSNQNIQADIQDNLIGTIGLLEAMVKHGQKRVVFLSSGGTVYGKPETIPIPETHPTNPVSSYGIVKLAIEKFLFLYDKRSGLRPIVLRPSNVYGPRHGHVGVQGIINTFLHRIKRGDELTVWGDGSSVRDYLYIADFVDLCLKLVDSEEHDVFNAGAARGYSIMELLDTMAMVISKKPAVSFEAARTFDVDTMILDSTKASHAFHWVPKVGLEEGIARTWEWIKQL